ncbi:hypothetical protein F-S17_0163 [Faustovirus]|nr:hypothetical protein F-LCD7_0178 [Faustovirus]QJX71942.1 hypothetical protein F-M6_0179 [Faustovirus]QJX72429.1 hypothetical protein F-S17_0163 [Faustovirus]QJX72939.1 hypothetical protein F-VV57_0177 [Faustovirus]QJX73444.1 hypothetical protein F-VV63_0178 [Faustovirus]
METFGDVTDATVITSVTNASSNINEGEIFCVECPQKTGVDEYGDITYCDSICMFKQDGCVVQPHDDADKNADGVKMLQFYCPNCKDVRRISSDDERVLVIDAGQVQEYMAHIAIKRNEAKMKKEMGRYKIGPASGRGTDIGRGMDIGTSLPSGETVEQLKLKYKLQLENKK